MLMMNLKKKMRKIMTLPRCEFCKWFHEETYTCKAFPDEIPNDKLWGDDDKECNNGIKFEKE